jgi:hypothetical protein
MDFRKVTRARDKVTILHLVRSFIFNHYQIAQVTTFYLEGFLCQKGINYLAPSSWHLLLSTGQ